MTGGGGAETKDLRGGATPEATTGELAVGTRFDGRYLLEDVLGEGGMGVVYAARDTSLGRDVAIKVLGEDAADATMVARFLQEARAAAAIDSEHVATVFEVGAAHGRPYLVMERLRGRDLHAELAERGRLPVAEAIDLVLQAALGVAHAHARDIVHRDLKPRNLFVAARPDGTRVVKVLDFGIAKAASSELTETGAVLGTTRYMAPEQLRSSRGVDARADVWALGVVLYELVTGASIFDATNSAELGVQILMDPHVPLRARVPELPAELEAVIDRCLVKDPGGRYQSVAELARALVALGGEAALAARIEAVLGPAASRPGAPAGGAPAETTTAARGEDLRPRPASAGNRVVIAALVFGVAGIAFGVAMLVRAPTGDTIEPTGPVALGSSTTVGRGAVELPPDAARVELASDAGTAAGEVPADGGAAPAPVVDAAPPPVRSPSRSATPSAAEVARIDAWCRKASRSRTSDALFVITGDSPISRDYVCHKTAALGCAGIPKRCASRAVTDAEKLACRAFLDGLTKVCP